MANQKAGYLFVFYLEYNVSDKVSNSFENFIFDWVNRSTFLNAISWKILSFKSNWDFVQTSSVDKSALAQEMIHNAYGFTFARSLTAHEILLNVEDIVTAIISYYVSGSFLSILKQRQIPHEPFSTRVGKSPWHQPQHKGYNCFSFPAPQLNKR